MEYKEYTTIDKSNWPRGEWDSEPDKVQFVDEETGLPCLAVRNKELGHWCGYVGVDESHPHYGKHYDDDLVSSTEVHWGLTFSGPCQNSNDESKYICHAPSLGETDKIWWLGFDCAHSGDLSPGMIKMYEKMEFRTPSNDRYRSLQFVKAQCHSLAKQLKENSCL